MAKITKPQFVALQKKHVTDTAIALAVGISRQAVHQLRCKLGIKSSRPDVRARNSAIVGAYLGGETGVSIADRYGLSISQTYRVLDVALSEAKKKNARDAAKTVRRAAKAAAAKEPAKKTAKKKKSK